MFDLSCLLRAPGRLSEGKVGIREGGVILSPLGTTSGIALLHYILFLKFYIAPFFFSSACCFVQFFCILV